MPSHAYSVKFKILALVVPPVRELCMPTICIALKIKTISVGSFYRSIPILSKSISSYECKYVRSSGSSLPPIGFVEFIVLYVNRRGKYL